MYPQPHTVLPAEWAPQRFVQLTWAHADTDWAYMLDKVNSCFVNIAVEIAKREQVLIVCASEKDVRKQLGKYAGQIINDNFVFVELPSNDTWARDHGGITVMENGKPTIFDFTFNGWGLKFAANHDNQITRQLYEKGIFGNETAYRDCLSIVLEGGSIESDGIGTLLTTAQCLLSPNRSNRTKAEMETLLTDLFGLKRVLWLHHGYLAGDDTDSHIDTLARFCDEKTIAYVQCLDKQDEHYDELQKMEQELQQFRTTDNRPYRLIALPMADEVRDENDERLPATYANFLIINGAVLMPTYNSPKDETAKQQLQEAFPDREIVGVNCLPLIKQHGSLHCVTMQNP